MRDLGLPRDALVNVIVRGEKAIPPRGSTPLLAGDELHLLISEESAHRVRDLIRRWRIGPIGPAPPPQRPVTGRRPISSVWSWNQQRHGDVSHPQMIAGQPFAEQLLDRLGAAGCELVSVRELADAGTISLETGDEVGKLAYGSGDIPFVRTSDLGTWELKLDPKQRVSRAVYDSLAGKQSARPRDLLVVRDGTYLVGSAAMVSEADVPLLFSGGVYRLRVKRPDELDPHLLLVLLWSTIVRHQIRAKRFTRDVIDTLGRRFEEIVLPIPTGELRNAIVGVARQLIETRIRLRKIVGDLGPAVQENRLPRSGDAITGDAHLPRARIDSGITAGD